MFSPLYTHTLPLLIHVSQSVTSNDTGVLPLPVPGSLMRPCDFTVKKLPPAPSLDSAWSCVHVVCLTSVGQWQQDWGHRCKAWLWIWQLSVSARPRDGCLFPPGDWSSWGFKTLLRWCLCVVFGITLQCLPSDLAMPPCWRGWCCTPSSANGLYLRIFVFCQQDQNIWCFNISGRSPSVFLRKHLVFTQWRHSLKTCCQPSNLNCLVSFLKGW